VVEEVDSDKRTVNVRQLGHPFSRYDAIPYSVPYCHPAFGEGFDFNPESGSVCLVVIPSDGTAPTVFAWLSVEEGDSFRGGRKFLNSGDFYFSTRDGNFIAIRRGGIVQVGSTALSQMVFIPIGNQVQQIFENLKFLGIPGELHWEVLREEEDSSGHQRCRLTLLAREYADDPKENPLLRLTLGSLSDGGGEIFRLETRSGGGGSLKTLFTLSKDGSVTWEAQGVSASFASLVLEITEDLDVTARNIVMTAKAALAISAATMSLKAGEGEVKLSGAGTEITGKVSLGDGLAPVLLYSQEMVLWMQRVTAACKSFDSTLKVPSQPASLKVNA
jgi:hypothetical protein